MPNGHFILHFEMSLVVYPLHYAKTILVKRNWHVKFSLTILGYCVIE